MDYVKVADEIHYFIRHVSSTFYLTSNSSETISLISNEFSSNGVNPLKLARNSKLYLEYNKTLRLMTFLFTFLILN